MDPRQFGTGYLRDLSDNLHDWRLPRAGGAPPSLPSKVDPRPNLYPSPPYNQSSANSCVGVSVGTMYGDVDRKQGGSDIDPSYLQIYYDGRKEDGLGGVDRGCYIRSALSAVAKKGVARAESWPYDLSRVNTAPPASVYVEAEKKQVIGYYRLDTWIDSMKQCIAEGYSFVAGNTLYENYYQIGSNGLVPMPQGKVIGGHAQKYAGYDDPARVFIVQGSWGLFGDRGFVYMPYAYAGDGDLTFDLWTIRKLEEVDEPDPPPIPPAGIVRFDAQMNVLTRGRLEFVPDTANPDVDRLSGKLHFTAPAPFVAKTMYADELRLVVKPKVPVDQFTPGRVHVEVRV